MWPIAGAGRSLSIPTWFLRPRADQRLRHRSPSTSPTRCGRTPAESLPGWRRLPSAAGTVQEIFQAATENFYAADASLIAPLILVGRQHWTDTYPAWPLLQRLGDGRPMGELIYCVDDVYEATRLLTAQSRPH